MKKIFISILTVSLFMSCTKDFDKVVDFTTVTNPNFSEEAVVGQPNSANILLTGVERQMSLAINEILILAELGSDNYVNTQTFFNQFMDGLDMRIADPDMRDTQFHIARLRELSLFGTNEVAPNDSEATDEIKAEFLFFEGMSYLYAGMYFSHLPQAPLGPTASSQENLNKAVATFQSAINLNSAKPEYHLAKARAHYFLGERTMAMSSASDALALSPNFTRSAKFDEESSSGPVNNMENALYQRATFDDLQPLPTLDFLDPKYSFLSPSEDAPVHYLKSEEAYLILAEGNISTDLNTAKDNLKNLLTLISTREVRNIDDGIEGRSQVDPGSRPDKSDIIVNGRANLVLDRQAGNIDVPSVSGTSLTVAEIDALSTEDESLELLYRTRQEVFIAEGIRLADMGVKLVIFEEEIGLNPNINEGDPGTTPTIPSFINSVVSDLDAFTYDPVAKTATTTIDLNKILVQNKTSNEVLPFH
jgi:tetratricopeptide (TPR) repeat protein